MQWTMGVKQLTILPPQAIEENHIEKVIVTISGLHDLNCIVSDLKRKYPNADFIMWYEI